MMKIVPYLFACTGLCLLPLAAAADDTDGDECGLEITIFEPRCIAADGTEFNSMQQFRDGIHVNFITFPARSQSAIVLANCPSNRMVQVTTNDPDQRLSHFWERFEYYVSSAETFTMEDIAQRSTFNSFVGYLTDIPDHLRTCMCDEGEG